MDVIKWLKSINKKKKTSKLSSKYVKEKISINRQTYTHTQRERPHSIQLKSIEFNWLK